MAHQAGDNGSWPHKPSCNAAFGRLSMYRLLSARAGIGRDDRDPARQSRYSVRYSCSTRTTARRHPPSSRRYPTLAVGLWCSTSGPSASPRRAAGGLYLPGLVRQVAVKKFPERPLANKTNSGAVFLGEIRQAVYPSQFCVPRACKDGRWETVSWIIEPDSTGRENSFDPWCHPRLSATGNIPSVLRTWA